MNLRTYHAYSMADALEAVKSDLGADAVILHTRTFRRGGLLGIGAKNIVEVTAADALPTAEGERRVETKSNGRTAVASVSASAVDAETAKAAGAATVSAMQARRAYFAGLEGLKEAANTTQAAKVAKASAPAVKPKLLTHAPVMSVSPSVQDEKPKITVPVQNAVSAPAKPSAPANIPPSEPPVKKYVFKDLESSRPAPLRNAPPKVEAPQVVTVAAPKAPARTVTPIVPAAPPRAEAPPASQVKAQAPSAGEAAETKAAQAMQDELAAIRSMVGQVLQRQSVSTNKVTPGVPTQLFDMYLQLIAHDLAEELADEVVSKVAKSLAADKFDDEEAVRGAVLAALAEYIPVAEPHDPGVKRDDRPLTIALVGPTGVGKTTTVAKMAATFKLHQNKSVGLVTCDTYRIAAVDQLTTYAKIIGVPLRVARSAEEMRLAVAEFAGCDVVLIDTAGRGQKDSERLEELREMVAAANPHEVHLVLSSTANEKVLLSEADAFAAIGADKIVLTKLDEAVSFGMLVNVLRQVGKRLSFVTTGQEVPDHFERGSAARMAELVLGTKGEGQ